MDKSKLPPQATDIEETVIGALLLESHRMIDVQDLLSANTFYSEKNKLVFDAIDALYKAEKKIDMMTVVEQLNSAGTLDRVGGAYQVTQYMTRVASSQHLVDHVMLLKEKQLKRDQINFGNELIKQGFDSTVDPFDTNTFANEQVYQIGASVETSQDKTNTELLRDLSKQMELAKTKQGISGLPTGFNRTDQLFGGYKEGNLIIKAGRPAMGKTAHALCEAFHMAVNFNIPVLFFSLEMTALQLMGRIVSIATGIDAYSISRGELSSDDWSIYNNTIQKIADAPLKIIDDVRTLQGIKNKSKKEHIKGNCKAIFVDYLQIVVNNMKGRSRENEISTISNDLKGLASNLKVPLIALCQLSRAVEQRGGSKMPMLSDLRESGSIEQDADIVQFLYRAEYYGFTEDMNGESTKGKALLLVAKHRAGSLDDIPLKWIARCTKFEPDNGETYEEIKQLQPNTSFEDGEKPF